MLNPIFWKKAQGQKHPGRWEIVECQIPSIKMLFKTNTKGHKHPSIRLYIIEQHTCGKPKKTKSGIQPRNAHSPEIESYRMWWGAAPPILNDTPVVCIYTSYNRTHKKCTRIVEMWCWRLLQHAVFWNPAFSSNRVKAWSSSFYLPAQLDIMWKIFNGATVEVWE